MSKLFNKGDHRLSIIYGRNGSGKSSIARAFKNYKENISNEFEKIELLNHGKNEIRRNNINYDIHVFDENFIKEKVQIKKNGLKSIVMFGEQVELDDKIDKNCENIISKEKEIIKLDKKLKLIEDEKNTDSPNFYINQIEANLKGDNSWASRDSMIKRNKRNSSVTYLLIKDIIKNHKTSKEFKNLKEEYIELKLDYDKVKEIDSHIKDELEYISLEGQLNNISQLFKEEISEYKLTGREKRIQDQIKKIGMELINKSYCNFKSNDISNCPYCFRDINYKEINDLLDSFDNVINEDIKNYHKKLSKSKLEKYNFKYDKYFNLNNNIIDKIKKLEEKINDFIMNINKNIEEKEQNPYKIINLDNSEILNLIKKYNLEINKFKEYIKNHNKKIESKDKLKNDLINKNKELAYSEIKDYYDNYLDKKTNEKKLVEDRKKIIDEKKELKKENIELSTRKNDINIAIDVINRALSYIFYDKNRIKLHTDGENYLLKVRGEEVLPGKVSVGERNAIALCYYFTMICENLEEENMYSRDSLIVIDDPISSFDSDNRIGILSYINREFKKILKSNENTRIIVMSHDSIVLDSFIKIGDDLGKILEYDNKKCYSLHKLENKKIINYKGAAANEYSFSMEKIYEFVIGDKDDLTIGNTMRRVLEAFSTFQYKKSFNELLLEDDILKEIKDESQRDRLESYMSRILLNDESHSELRVKSIDNINLPSIYTLEEKQRTGKAVLCLMYLLNKNHIKYHLIDEEKVININHWAEEYKTI